MQQRQQIFKHITLYHSRTWQQSPSLSASKMGDSPPTNPDILRVCVRQREREKDRQTIQWNFKQNIGTLWAASSQWAIKTVSIWAHSRFINRLTVKSPQLSGSFGSCIDSVGFFSLNLTSVSFLFHSIDPANNIQGLTVAMVSLDSSAMVIGCWGNYGRLGAVWIGSLLWPWQNVLYSYLLWGPWLDSHSK